MAHDTNNAALSTFINQNELPAPWRDFTPQYLMKLHKQGKFVRPLRLTARSGLMFLRRDVAAFIERLEQDA